MLVSVLVLAAFSLILLMALQQRRAAQQRQLKLALETRLDREVERELLRLSPKSGPQGAERVRQALDNILARSFDELLALEGRQAALRRALRQNPNVAQRRRMQQELRRIGQELEIAKLWVLMLEDRRQTARKLETSRGGDAKKPPGTVPSQVSAPRLPDWLSALQ